jgi:membrane protein required for colicin V production
LNWIDALIFVTFAWFMYAAFNAGLIREVITIIGAIFAVALAGLFYVDLAENLEVIIEDEETRRIIAFAVLFGAVMLASYLLAMFLKTAASVLFLGLADSLGGAAFGFLKAFILVEIALIFFITFPSLNLVDDVEDSGLAPIFLDFLPVLKSILPGEFKTAIDTFVATD